MGRARRVAVPGAPDVWLTDGHDGPLPVAEPMVVHLQEASWRHESTRPVMQPWFIEQFERKSRAAAERAAVIITPSGSSRAQILGQYAFDPGRVHAVPLGVDLALFRPGRPGAGDIIEAAGGDPSAPYVLFVSSLSPRKNLGSLKTAMNALARRGLPHNLVIVGSPPPTDGTGRTWPPPPPPACPTPPAGSCSSARSATSSWRRSRPAPPCSACPA